MPTVSEFLYQRIHEKWGVQRIYGYPGDGINGLMGDLTEFVDQGKIDFVQVRHEEMAAFMACAHAKFTGEVGVCMATSGPGAIHLLNGLYDAKLDHQPVVAIVGQQPRTALGVQYQQEVDLNTLFKDVASEYVHQMSSPAQARQLIDRAFKIAKSERAVTCIIIPHDLQTMDVVDPPPRSHGSVYTSSDFRPPVVIPREEDLRAAAEVLNSGQKVAMLIGQGAAEATAEVMEAADKLGCGVAKALLGKDALPDYVPYCTGPIGLLGSRPSYVMMNECDTLFMVGTSFPYAEWLPEPGQARGVEINIDGKMVGTRYENEVNLIGDSKRTLQALLPMLEEKPDRSWREKLESEVKDWWRLLEDRAYTDADPVNPQLAFWELSKRLPDRAIVTTDSGSSANWYARDLVFREGMKGSLSGNLATMGPGVPYAIAAKVNYPDRPVFALIGDGAMQMNGMNELITASRLSKDWSNPTFIVMVLNNHDLNQVTWEQRVMEGDPKVESSQVLPDVNYADYARLIGFHGIRVESPDEVGPAWDEALAATRPVILDMRTDPEVPPLPPHIKMEQAKGIMGAFMGGDPGTVPIIRQTVKEKLPEFLPGR
jgi:pyruvate dehydrogenase (quinone)